MEHMVKRIYLTVDTECHQIENLNRTIYGKTKNGEVYGIEKILQLGQELSIPVNVFLDIPECHRYGDDHIRRIVELVNQYNQPIFLHVHPDYIGDSKRKHLWEYSEDEQRRILQIALEDYTRFCGIQKKVIFRAGAWGVNDKTYKVLRELLPAEQYEVIDLSYLYKSNWRCQLTYEEYGAANTTKNYKGISVFPNTTYINYDFFGKKIPTSLNVPNPNLGEFKKVIKNNTLHNITYTMHSWDFIKRWFFLPNHISGDKYIVWKFKKSVRFAQRKGYVFEDLRNFSGIDEIDQCQNICTGLIGKVSCLWHNYLAFAVIGRSYKKYAILYFLPVIVLFIILGVLLLIL